MAKARRYARNIVVNDVKYRWSTKGNDGEISLVVWPDELPGPTITCRVGYHHIPIPTGNGSALLTRQVVVTNRLVRQVIEYAMLKLAYDPRINGKQVDLRSVDEVIDLSIAVRSA
jgi:hypothetical protein